MPLRASERRRAAFEKQPIRASFASDLATGARRAFHPDLQPGMYTFRVRALNSPGLENRAAERTGARVQPPLYRQPAFVATALAVVVALLVLVFKYLVTKRSKAELEREVEQRTRQLRHSGERYRSLVVNAVFGIFRATREGAFQAINPALATILGYEDERAIRTLNLRRDVFVRGGHWDEIFARGSERGHLAGEEVMWRRRDGSQATVRLSGRWVEPEDGKPPVCEMIAEDVTALVNARNSELEAERLRGVQKLAIAVAHEFNNPLSILLGMYQLYVEPELDKFDEDARRRLEKVPSIIARMKMLVNRLLRLTRLREDEYIPGTSFLNLEQSADRETEDPERPTPSHRSRTE